MFTIPCTAFSFDVEHTATLAPCSNASATILFTPGRNGSAPSFTSSKNISVFLRCSFFTNSFRASGSVTLFHGSASGTPSK